MTKTCLMFEILAQNKQPLSSAQIAGIMKSIDIEVTGQTIAGYMLKLAKKRIVSIYGGCGTRGGMGYKLNRRTLQAKLLIKKYREDFRKDLS